MDKGPIPHSLDFRGNRQRHHIRRTNTWNEPDQKSARNPLVLRILAFKSFALRILPANSW
jgi:hypothetical protein